MTDIEQARTILTKWGDGATPGPWWTSEPLSEDLSAELAYDLGVVGGGDETLATVHGPSSDATLIVAMTDPALREALDGILELAQQYGALPRGRGSRFIERAEHLAATIIAIDQRMNA